jgi:hypothetical protein
MRKTREGTIVYSKEGIRLPSLNKGGLASVDPATPAP